MSHEYPEQTRLARIHRTRLVSADYRNMLNVQLHGRNCLKCVTHPKLYRLYSFLSVSCAAPMIDSSSHRLFSSIPVHFGLSMLPYQNDITLIFARFYEVSMMIEF